MELKFYTLWTTGVINNALGMDNFINQGSSPNNTQRTCFIKKKVHKYALLSVSNVSKIKHVNSNCFIQLKLRSTSYHV